MFDFYSDLTGVKISVVGHVMVIHNQLIDMRMPNWINEVGAECEGLWLGRNLKLRNGQSLQAIYNDFVNACQRKSRNWGNCEQEFDTLAGSDDDFIRAAVALNGRYAENLSNDEQCYVRLNVINSLINDKARGVERDDSFIHYMIGDPAMLVREALARYGNEEQLEVLINDAENGVRLAVAKHSKAKHLEQLMDDESYQVRKWIAQHGSIAQAQSLASDSDEHVRKAVANRAAELDPIILDALVTDSATDVRQALAEFAPTEIAAKLVSDKNTTVRVLLARRGIALETLKSDAHENVRVEVARLGYALGELVFDVDAEVRGSAIAYPAVFLQSHD